MLFVFLPHLAFVNPHFWSSAASLMLTAGHTPTFQNGLMLKGMQDQYSLLAILWTVLCQQESVTDGLYEQWVTVPAGRSTAKIHVVVSQQIQTARVKSTVLSCSRVRCCHVQDSHALGRGVHLCCSTALHLGFSCIAYACRALTTLRFATTSTPCT